MSFKMKGWSPFKQEYKPPTIEYGKLPSNILGRYIHGEGRIVLSERYNNPMMSPKMLKEKQETIKHETKHHYQYHTLGKEGYLKKYKDDHQVAIEGHMDPYIHAPEDRQKEDWEVNPEVKTAKKYQSVNPALEQITVDRFNKYWQQRGQYETPGTLEFEAEKAMKKASPGLFKIQRNTRRKRRR